MQRLLIRFAINAAAIFVAAQLIPGIHMEGWQGLALATVIFGVVNALIRPLVLVTTCLLNLLTLGLFTLVVNAAMLWLTSWVAERLAVGFYVADFGSAFLGALLISVVSFILTRVVR